MRAGVYGRESQDNRASVDDQVSDCVTGCGNRGWTVVRHYSDGTSASRFRRKDRGDWAALIADAKAGQLDVIVVWETSRGDRDMETWVSTVAMCRTAGVLVHVESHRRTYDPRNLRDWKALMEDGLDAAYESEKTSARVRRGLAMQVERGRPHGRTTYGHERIYGPDGKLVRQQPHPEHAPIVRAIIERVAKGDPINAITRELNESAVPPPEAAVWRNSTIRAIALNPAHIGKRERDGELREALWPALVSDATWERAGRVLRGPDRVRSAPGALKWLLSYLATSPCGSPLNGNAYRAGGHRPRYACHADGCVSITVAEADMVIADVVITRLARDDARGLLVADDGEAEAANAEADRLQRRLDEWRDNAADDEGITPAALAKIERKLLPQIAAARERARRAEPVVGLGELIDAVERSEADAQRVWGDMLIPAQRGVVSLLMTVQLGPALRPLTRWSSDEDRLASAWERLIITPAPRRGARP